MKLNGSYSLNMRPFHLIFDEKYPFMNGIKTVVFYLD